jgi:dTDP-4-amino-4,6-dideoxygalactose transaminase
MLQRKIPYADPYITEEDVRAVAEAVRNKRLSQGEYVEKLEQDFAYHLKRKYALATSNGTAALHLAVLAIGLQSGDEVIVPSFTFAATANCVLYVGAKPIFVDIDPDTYNIDPEKIEKSISPNTKAIIVVHYGGQIANMDPILEIAEKYDLHVVEDATEAHGATYKNHKAGTIGEIGCFSFYPNKNMTTGEGGMLVTDDEKIAERVRLLRNHGQHSRFHHIIIGYNYKMTDIQAALGIVQLKRLNWVLQKKKEAAKYYEELLLDAKGIQLPYVMPNATHTYMFYTVKFLGDGVRNSIMQFLAKRGIETVIAFPPVHLQPFYRSLFGYNEGFLPVTEDCAKRVLSLPIYPHIKREDQEFIVDSIMEGLKN